MRAGLGVVMIGFGLGAVLALALTAWLGKRGVFFERALLAPRRDANTAEDGRARQRHAARVGCRDGAIRIWRYRAKSA